MACDFWSWTADPYGRITIMCGVCVVRLRLMLLFFFSFFLGLDWMNKSIRPCQDDCHLTRAQKMGRSSIIPSESMGHFEKAHWDTVILAQDRM